MYYVHLYRHGGQNFTHRQSRLFNASNCFTRQRKLDLCPFLLCLSFVISAILTCLAGECEEGLAI